MHVLRGLAGILNDAHRAGTPVAGEGAGVHNGKEAGYVSYD